MRNKKGKGMRDWTDSVPPMPESWKLQNPTDTKLFTEPSLCTLG